MALEDLQRDIETLEADGTLLAPEQLRRRIEVLDVLETRCGVELGSELETNPSAWVERARALRTRLEAANAEVYEGIRRQIHRGAGRETLERWIGLCRRSGEERLPGLSYDALDELLAGALRMEEPARAPEHPGPERVFYQPTPVRHVLDLIRQSGLSAADVLIDLGSGLGQVCMLVSLLTGAQAAGIEAERAYVASARACAASLGMSGVTFVEQDAREADLSAGTVFWLYTPFSGSLLEAVLRRLEHEAATRTIRIGTLGPCTRVVAEEAWLQSSMPATVDRVSVFVSRR